MLDALARGISLARARRMLRLSIITFTVTVAGCTLPQAPRPQIPRDANACTRAQLYVANKLTFHDGLFKQTFERGKDEYVLANLDDVLAPYPRSSEVRHDIGVRGAVIGGILGAGAALAGYTVGFNATAPSADRWSTNGQLTSYGIAGGLILTGIVTSLLWGNPIDHLAGTYNDELRADIAPTPCP
jgi:hypothetical protein